jgi:hypothetical protein
MMQPIIPMEGWSKEELIARIGELQFSLERSNETQKILAEKHQKAAQAALEMHSCLSRLVAAKACKDAHGETLKYKQLKHGQWEAADAILAKYPAQEG